MFRFLILLVGMLSTSRPGNSGRGVSYRDGDPDDTMPQDAAPPDSRDTMRLPRQRDLDDGGYGRGWPMPPESPPPARPARIWPGRPEGGGPGRPRRRRVPLKYKWAAVIVVAGLVFRKAVAWAVLAALSAALHIVGINVHLPHISLSWPWQTSSSGTTTSTDLGPWVLQKIEGISHPALGTENFDFTFTRKVSHSIGFWPCWYQSTFAAVGHASATVDLNPGSSWWAPSSGHYQLRVLSRPAAGQAGQVSVALVLPQPQLPQSVHDVTVDNTLSHPIDTQHSWTYPGLGCGELIKPQFAESVLYAQAQSIAFSKVRSDAQISDPLISAAKSEASQIIRSNFIQPTVNALGYKLTSFSIRWTNSS